MSDRSGPLIGGAIYWHEDAPLDEQAVIGWLHEDAQAELEFQLRYEIRRSLPDAWGRVRMEWLRTRTDYHGNMDKIPLEWWNRPIPPGGVAVTASPSYILIGRYTAP